MLAIHREPYYKNKLLLSSVAVMSGFLITVGVIRAVNPPDTSIQQSAQTSDRRASSLLPINASSSETASESGDDGSQAQSSSSSGASSDSRMTSSSGLTTPSVGGTSSTSSQTSTSSTTQPSPTPSNGNGGSGSGSNDAPVCETVDLGLLGMKIVCL